MCFVFVLWMLWEWAWLSYCKTIKNLKNQVTPLIEKMSGMRVSKVH